MHAKYQLITTHEYLLQYAVEYKTQKLLTTSHHNIYTIILDMETPKKTQDGKMVQWSDIDFIMKKYGTFRITANSPKPGECSTWKNHWANPS